VAVMLGFVCEFTAQPPDRSHMQTTLKQLTDFFQEVGADQVNHSDKTYLAHAIGVYNDLKKWGWDEDLARTGIFHSIYGTELFQDFKLPLDRRSDVRALIGERAEWLAYLNCAMDRTHFDAEISKAAGPYTILDRFEETEITVFDADFHDLCFMHLCDWTEQVERWDNWDYRREAYQTLAKRLGGIALTTYDQVFANAPPAKRS